MFGSGSRAASPAPRRGRAAAARAARPACGRPTTSRERLRSRRTSWNRISLAVGRVQERHAVLALVATRSAGDAAGVALGLGQHALRPDRELLGLDHPDNMSAVAESIVCRAVRGLVLLDGRGREVGHIDCRLERDNIAPVRFIQPRIDARLARATLALFCVHGLPLARKALPPSGCGLFSLFHLCVMLSVWDIIRPATSYGLR